MLYDYKKRVIDLKRPGLFPGERIDYHGPIIVARNMLHRDRTARRVKVDKDFIYQSAWVLAYENKWP